MLGVGTWIRESHIKYIHIRMTVGFCINDFLLTYFLLYIFFMVKQKGNYKECWGKLFNRSGKGRIGSIALECN